MNINIAEITCDDVSEECFDRLIKSFKIDESAYRLHSVSVVSFLDHDKIIRENFELKAKIKDLKSNIIASIFEIRTQLDFYDTYLN